MVMGWDDGVLMRACWGLIVILAGGAGCIAPRPPLSVENPDPSIKIPAMKVAVEKKDLRAACQMVRDLESDDPAVRFYAIEALYKLTGERMGYEFYVDADQRQAAVKRWRQWAAEQGCEGFALPASNPTSAPTSLPSGGD